MKQTQLHTLVKETEKTNLTFKWWANTKSTRVEKRISHYYYCCCKLSCNLKMCHDHRNTYELYYVINPDGLDHHAEFQMYCSTSIGKDDSNLFCRQETHRVNNHRECTLDGWELAKETQLSFFCSHCEITHSFSGRCSHNAHTVTLHSLSGHCSHNAHTLTLPTVSVATVPTMLRFVQPDVMNFTNKTQMDYFFTSKRAKFIWFTKENYFDFLNRVRLRHMQSQNKRGKCQSSRQSMCTDA